MTEEAAPGPAGGRWGRWAAHPLGPVLLFLFAVLEGTLFPAPTEALLVALVLVRPGRAGPLVAVATLGSVAGGGLGYAAGTLLYGEWVRPVLEWNGLVGPFESLGGVYAEHSALPLATSGFTPIPYLVYTTAAGAFGVPLGSFVLFSLVGRGLKYGVVGAVAWRLGPAVEGVVRRWGLPAAGAALALLAAGYLLLTR